MTPPRLFILNQMAGPITWELAADLGDALGEVALLTGHPDTLQKGHDHVALHPAAPYQRGSFTRRAFSWLHYWCQALWWIVRRPRRTPMLLFSNPPLLPWLGYVLNRLRGQPYAVMVHDIYPDVLVRLQGFAPDHPLVRLWLAFNRRAYERAAVVMTLGETMAATLARQFDPGRTAAGEIVVVYPWADTAVVHPRPKAENWFALEHQQVDRLSVMYSGNMGLGHDIESMLAAAAALRDDERFHFFFIGAGPKWSVVAAAQTNAALPNVTLLGWLPEEAIPFSLATADFALVSLEDELQGLAVPSKGVFALAAGSLLVVIAGADNELAAWVDAFESGVTIPTGDPQALAAALRSWADDPARLASARARGRAAAQEHFDRSQNTRRIADLLRRHLGLTDNPSAPRSATPASIRSEI